MPQLNPWRELARKAAQAIRRQLAQTESGLSRLLNPAGQPQSIPIPIPIPRRQGRLPNSKRFYTESLRPLAPRPRNAGPSSFIKTEFGRTALRPRLVGTTRAHGFRQFSTAPVNHAHVMREVQASIAQGIRAGVLNTPFFPPPTEQDKTAMTTKHIVAGVMAGDTSRLATRFVIDLVPPPLVLARRGELRTQVLAEIDETILSFPAFMSKLRRDLSLLSRAGRLSYEISDNNRMVLTFPGKTKEQVEAWLKDIGVSRGTVYEEHGFLQSSREQEEIDWNAVFARRMSDVSLETYVDAIDAHRCGHALMV